MGCILAPAQGEYSYPRIFLSQLDPVLGVVSCYPGSVYGCEREALGLVPFYQPCVFSVAPAVMSWYRGQASRGQGVQPYLLSNYSEKLKPPLYLLARALRL